MQNAIFVTSTESLRKYCGDPAFDRLYFGQEFCERLIPSYRDFYESFEFAKKRGMLFTLVTPFVTQEGLEKWGGIIEEYSKISPCGEIVVNDFGISEMIDEKFPEFEKILGRLLTKQKRGPQILNLIKKTPGKMLDHFSRFNADAPSLSEFYNKIGFSRIELDNTLQEIKRDSKIPASLYYPYICVSTTRMCLTNGSDNRKKPMRAIFPCKKECKNIRFKISHNEIPVPVIISGNTQFIYNGRLPENLSDIYIDRLVYMPEIPI